MPSGVTFTSTGILSGTPGAGAAGTYTVCINAVNGVTPSGTQVFTLTISTDTLVISSAAVSGSTSGTPNLGPITVRRQSSSGIPITDGAALTVNLTSSSPGGASFGPTQFASVPETSVTIPSGQSAATFWYGSTTGGGFTVTGSASGYVPGTQQETITTAPASLGLAPAAGSTGSPVLSCGAPAASATCTVTGVGPAGRVVFSVTFWNSAKSPVIYSASQASPVWETGQSAGSVTIEAGAATSLTTLSAGLGTSALTFGPYTLTINVDA